MKKVLADRKDVAFYVKLFPLKFHPDSHWKSQSMVCRKSVQLLEDNFDKKPIPKPDCDTDVIDKNVKLAESLGITGTPTLIMPDGFVAVGAMKSDILTKVVLQHQRKPSS